MYLCRFDVHLYLVYAIRRANAPLDRVFECVDVDANVSVIG